MQYKNYYKILGVDESVTAEGVKKAYRKLAIQYHPDRNPNNKAAEDKFKEVTEAYQVLSNEIERKKYDSFSTTFKHNVNHKKPDKDFTPHPTDPNFEWNSNVNENFNARDIFNEVFGDIFASAKEKARNLSTPKANDLRYDLKISLEEAMMGCAKKIKYMRKTEKGSEPVTLSVNIPAGVKPGQRLKLKDEGDRALNQKAGDLYVVIQYKPHPLFTIDKLDIVSEVPISIVDAIQGTEIEVLTLTGTVKVNLPAGISSGQVLRLKGKGLKPIKASTAGDLLVKVTIDTPKNLSDEELSKIKSLNKIFSRSPGITSYNKSLREIKESR